MCSVTVRGQREAVRHPTTGAEEWQLVIKKRNNDPHDVDELHLNLALRDSVAEADRPGIVEEVEPRLLHASEVKVNSTRLLSLNELLELLGMETQMKEKRIVDLRAAMSSQPSVTVKP